MSDIDFKYAKCDCNGKGCEKCCCEDCGDWLFTYEESKCFKCICAEIEGNEKET